MQGLAIQAMHILNIFFDDLQDQQDWFQPRDHEPVKPRQELAKPMERLALFFHGAQTPRYGFSSLMALCEKQGFATRRYPKSPMPYPHSLHVRDLHRYLEGLVVRHRNLALKQLLFVGHGAGGLLARAAIEWGKFGHISPALITLGTPHEPLCSNLPERDERFLNVPFLNIIGGYDTAVKPSRAFHPQAKAAHFHLSHTTLLNSAEVLQAVRAFLGHPASVAQPHAA